MRQALEAKQKPAAVAALCTRARELIVLAHGVTLTPESTPSRADGEQLFAQTGCTTCHGADGSAQTEAASKLDPQAGELPRRRAHGCGLAAPRVPRDQLRRRGHGDAARIPQLSDKQRWDLAFYVLSLRHAREDRAAGQRWFDARSRPSCRCRRPGSPR